MKPPGSEKEWKICMHGAFTIPFDMLGITRRNQSCHTKLSWLAYRPSRDDKHRRRISRKRNSRMTTVKKKRHNRQYVTIHVKGTCHPYNTHGGPTGQEPRRNQCIVGRDEPQDEVCGGRDREEVSEMHVRSLRVGILDSVTRQHTAINHSKSCEAFKKIVQEFANNSTTGQEAMHIERIEAGATAPTTACPPWLAETSEDSWQECDAINAMGSQQCSTCKGYGHVPWDCPKGSTTSERTRGHTNGKSTTGTRATTTGSAV